MFASSMLKKNCSLIHVYGTGPWVLWWADQPAGGSAGAGACTHGDVYWAGHPLLQVQAWEDERAPRTLLVES